MSDPAEAKETPATAAPTEPIQKPLPEAQTGVDTTQPSEPTEKPALEPSSKVRPPTWPELPTEHPLRSLKGKLLSILHESQHSEIWGITLSANEPVPFTTLIILQKFLRANANNVEKAADQLLATLKWRKEFDPVKAKGETFDGERFGGLGYVTVLDRPGSGAQKEVCTWNIYGAVKDNKKTFGDVDSFLRWRVALMEHSLTRLDLASATTPIPDHGQGADPYQMTQVHDYLNVSFLRMDPAVKAASKTTIETFQSFYPELLARKFFVNVPVIMGWVFSAMKVFMAEETRKKLVVLSYGNQVAAELGEGVPEVYGGKGGPLEKVGETVSLTAGSVAK